MSGGLFVGFSYEHGYYKGGLQPVLACPAAVACPYEGGSDSLGISCPFFSVQFLQVLLSAPSNLLGVYHNILCFVVVFDVITGVFYV